MKPRKKDAISLMKAVFQSRKAKERKNVVHVGLFNTKGETPMSKKTTMAIAVAATLAFPLTAFAQGAGGAGGAGGSGSAGAGASQADTAPGAPGVKGDQMGNTKPGDATKKQTTGANKGNTTEPMAPKK